MRRIFATIALILAIGACSTAAPKESGIPPVAPAYCAAEDELPMTLQTDAYGYKAGQTFCIHIDRVRGE